MPIALARRNGDLTTPMNVDKTGVFLEQLPRFPVEKINVVPVILKGIGHAMLRRGIGTRPMDGQARKCYTIARLHENIYKILWLPLDLAMRVPVSRRFGFKGALEM